MKTKIVLFPIEVPHGIYCYNVPEQIFCKYFSSSYMTCELELCPVYDKRSYCYIKSEECLDLEKNNG